MRYSLHIWLLVVIIGFSVPCDARDYKDLSIERLMALHLDSSAKVDRLALKPALRKKLEALSLAELMELEQQIPRDNTTADFQILPLAACLDANSVVVQGRVLHVQFTREGIVNNILQRYRGNYELLIEVAVIRRYPEDPVQKTLTYKINEGWEFRDYFQPGSEYLLLFHQRGGILFGGGFGSAYPIEGNGRVWNAVEGASLPVEEMWRVVKDQIDQVRGNRSDDVVTTWNSKLRSDNLEECVAALNSLAAAPETTPGPSVILNVLEHQYELLRAQLDDTSPTYENQMTFAALARIAFDVLDGTATPDVVKRLFELYVRDRTSTMPLFDFTYESSALDVLMVALVAASPALNRREMLTTLFRRTELLKNRYHAIETLRDVQGDDIVQFLRDLAQQPDSFCITHWHELSAVWAGLAAHGDTSLKAVWERAAEEDMPTEELKLNDGPPAGVSLAAREALEILAASQSEEDLLRLYLQHHAHGDSSAASRFGQRVTRGSRTAIQLLADSDVPLEDFARIIAEKLADSVLVPELLEAAERDPSLDVVRALHACGAQADAVRIVVKRLESAADGTDDDSEYEYFRELESFAELVAEVRDAAASDVLQRFVSGKALEHLYVLADRRQPDADYERRRWPVTQFEQKATVAFAVCAGPDAKPVLRRIVKDITRDPSTRLIAAWALTYFGDDGGAELVQAYVERDPDLPAFPVSPAFLRSEHTDRLILQRLQKGFDWSDSAIFNTRVMSDASPARQFLRDYEVGLLEVLARYVSSSDFSQVQRADFALREMTGLEFGHVENSTYIVDDDAPQQWRAYINRRVAETR